ncbi:hypothetical protein OXPF_10170 [Oxobacter pfennigii]|uniref:Uncharacterized protein n=1 Tax=Oxobacter pfennigii TaxID=36849 RepID=A0A0P8X4S7_9CLOT|nr:hypothetical protein [Oxobacter pfennigii]KPU45782.1 hypothetical protein OXPF_10170 [Oxobacter pfennigii]
MDSASFENFINKITGVINSKVIWEEGEITEVHVLANKQRSAKQIARDIESAILVTFSYRVDKNKISIAQIETETSADSTGRIIFEGFSLRTYDNTIEYNVELSFKEETYSVTETGLNTMSGRIKTMAKSTLKAVEKIINDGAIFDVADIIVNKNHTVPYVCVMVNMIFGGKEEILIGSAIIKDDLNETISKAALDAINRRVYK